MKKLAARLFSRTEQAPSDVDQMLLEAHFSSIKVSLLQIRNFTKKKIARTPTYIHWKEIDIEMAWPSSKEFLFETYDIFCGISTALHEGYDDLGTNYSFKQTLDVTVTQVDRIAGHIYILLETGCLSTPQLEMINPQILRVQQAVNRLHKYIMSDFDYSA
jgi:hypothetical protein